MIKVVSTSILIVKPSFCSCKGFIHNDIPLWDDLTTLRWFWDNLSLFLPLVPNCSMVSAFILLGTKKRRVTPTCGHVWCDPPKNTSGSWKVGWTTYLWILSFENSSKSPKKKHGKLSILQKKEPKKFSLVLWCFNYTPKRTASHASPQKKMDVFLQMIFPFQLPSLKLT